MKTRVIKSIVLAVIVLLVSSNISIAQVVLGKQKVKITKAEKIDNMLAELSEDLSLTKEQQSTVSAIYTQHFEKVKAEKEIEKEQEKAAKAEYKKLKEELISQVLTELNDDQVVEYVKFNAEHHPKSKIKLDEWEKAKKRNKK